MAIERAEIGSIRDEIATRAGLLPYTGPYSGSARVVETDWVREIYIRKAKADRSAHR